MLNGRDQKIESPLWLSNFVGTEAMIGVLGRFVIIVSEMARMARGLIAFLIVISIYGVAKPKSIAAKTQIK